MSSGIPYWPCDKCNKSLLDEHVYYTCYSCDVQLCKEHAEGLNNNLVCVKCGKPLKKHEFKLSRSYYPND